VVESAWVGSIGVPNITVREYAVEGEDYGTMIASVSAGAGENYYDKVAGLLYRWLLDKGHYLGTIV